MPNTLTTARRALSKLGARGRTTRIPDDVRAVVLAYARQARSGGASWQRIGEQLGLSPTVVQRWSKAAAPSVKLQPVVVSDQELAPTGPLVIVTAGGERLEGLGLDEAVRVLKALR